MGWESWVGLEANWGSIQDTMTSIGDRPNLTINPSQPGLQLGDFGLGSGLIESDQ